MRQPIRFRRLDDNQFKKFSDFPRQGSDGLSLVLINEQKHWKGKQPNIGTRVYRSYRKSRPINK